MKTSLVVIGFSCIMAARCAWPWKATERSEPASSQVKADTVEMSIAQGARIVSFEKDIRPVFENRCQPCHFPGGKMHAKLPFDRAETIVEIGEGFFSRIKDEQEQQLIQAFLEQQTD